MAAVFGAGGAPLGGATAPPFGTAAWSLPGRGTALAFGTAPGSLPAPATARSLGTTPCSLSRRAAAPPFRAAAGSVSGGATWRRLLEGGSAQTGSRPRACSAGSGTGGFRSKPGCCRGATVGPPVFLTHIDDACSLGCPSAPVAGLAVGGAALPRPVVAAPSHAGSRSRERSAGSGTGGFNSGPGFTRPSPGHTDSSPRCTSSAPGCTASGLAFTRCGSGFAGPWLRCAKSGPGLTDSVPGGTGSGPGGTSSWTGLTGSGVAPADGPPSARVQKSVRRPPGG